MDAQETQEIRKRLGELNTKAYYLLVALSFLYSKNAAFSLKSALTLTAAVAVFPVQDLLKSRRGLNVARWSKAILLALALVFALWWVWSTVPSAAAQKPAPSQTAEQGFAPSSRAQWASAIATFIVVLVALRDRLFAWWGNPSLDPTCTKDSPWTVRTAITVFDRNTGNILWTGDCYYVRVEVMNSGKTRAEKVQVYASNLARELGGNFEDIEGFIPLNLKWANSPPDRPLVVLDGISPKMGAFCDIVSLCDPSNPHQRRPQGTQPSVTIGQLQLEVEPTNGLHLLPPGRYRLTLRIAAANAKPIDRYFVFEHTGNWLQDDSQMRQNCLDVSLTDA